MILALEKHYQTTLIIDLTHIYSSPKARPV